MGSERQWWRDPLGAPSWIEKRRNRPLSRRRALTTAAMSFLVSATWVVDGVVRVVRSEARPVFPWIDALAFGVIGTIWLMRGLKAPGR